MERRPDLLDAIKSKLIEADGGPVGVTTALEGRGGFGKSTLAAMIAQDPDVQDAFLDGVFWVLLDASQGPVCRHCSGRSTSFGHPTNRKSRTPSFKMLRKSLGGSRRIGTR